MRGKYVHPLLAGCFAVILIFTSACSGTEMRPRGIHDMQMKHDALLNRAHVNSNGRSELDTAHKAIGIVYLHGKPYVLLTDLVNALEYQSVWVPEKMSLSFGSGDGVYQVQAGSRAAENGDQHVKLPAIPVLDHHHLYLPVEDIQPLFAGDLKFRKRNNQIQLLPQSSGASIKDLSNSTNPPDSKLPDFADDPDDPALLQPSMKMAPGDASKAVPALKNINMRRLIETAKRYKGVKYRFGAKPYPVSHRFDCSSYTKFIYGKFGVYLPRLSRAQARHGIWVSRSHLRRGDLVFFYVPGRFRSNRKVGHVGIYIGRGYMINADSAPRNGVQINYINTHYWKKTFLLARRVAY